MLRAIAAATAQSTGAIPESEKGQPNGVASLDGTGKVPASELPPLQHDVGEAANQVAMLALPVTAPAICLRTDFTPPHLFFLTADPATLLANWHDTGELGAGGANPSALVGPSAVNGVSNFYMRADGAPAINLTAAYAWTGQHSFAANTGFGTTTPHAPIQTGNAIVNRKVVMFEAADNDHQYYGFGVNSNILRYQTSGTTAAHVFYAAASATVSNELFRIYGTGGFLSPSQSFIVTGADGSKLWLAKYSSGTGHTDAPKTLGAASTYLYVGGREYASLGFAGIGFGYISDTSNHPCVWIGHEEIDTAGNTTGDFVVATRPTTTNVAPTERFRITKDGVTRFAGTIGTYNGTATAGVGMPAIYAKYDTASHSANIAPTTLYTVPASGAGMYRVFVYAVKTQAATTSSTLPNVGILWTDADANVALSSTNVSPTNAVNDVGAFGNGAIVINARAGTIIQFQTSNYASAGATAMQYAVHLRLEYLG